MDATDPPNSTQNNTPSHDSYIQTSSQAFLDTKTTFNDPQSKKLASKYKHVRHTIKERYRKLLNPIEDVDGTTSRLDGKRIITRKFRDPGSPACSAF